MSKKLYSFFIEPSHLKKLKLIAFDERKNVSELIREAITAFIQQKGYTTDGG